jgi:hypothetical protein
LHVEAANSFDQVTLYHDGRGGHRDLERERVVMVGEGQTLRHCHSSRI